ncbi:hypothetical protein NFIA_053910 [Paecilomyces variotii No. 5]|uniref:Uncharacterized protein n=1 Tax=Byssochlamys spectabilis (strain No. 5 / NBRC 109023) TaxID=1356009 RepID=V5FYG2_BYSSN|nr:hypothetical protein NFIA_053910 [Paecilomyces variotii No. 5]
MGPVGAMPLLLMRDVASDVESAPSTFSSWDKCMQKAYCKWPVIVGIVIGAAILIAIACCCCPSPGSGGGKRSKYADDPSYHRPPPPPSQPYQAPAAPAYRGAEPTSKVAQFAQFETPSKKVDDDALPPMPSWETAMTRKIEDTTPQSEDVEMDQLKPSVQPTDMVRGPGRQPQGGYSQVPSHPTSPQPGYFPPQRAMEHAQQYPPQQFPQQSRSPGPGRPYTPQQMRSPGPGRPYGPPLDTGVGVAAYSPQQPRSPGPGRPYGTPVDMNAGEVYGGQPELRGDAPYQSRRQRAPSFHRPQPYGDSYGQNMSPVSPPRAQPPYGGMQRRPTYASDTAPPSYTTEPPQQGFAPSPVHRVLTPEQRQPSLPTVEPQAPYQNAPYGQPKPQPQPTYAAYQPQSQQSYAAYSPPATSSPPPNIGLAHSDEDHDSGRPPSLLQVGPKPGAQTRY